MRLRDETLLFNKEALGEKFLNECIERNLLKGKYTFWMIVPLGSVPKHQPYLLIF
jgi:hypothetical protein